MAEDMARAVVMIRAAYEDFNRGDFEAVVSRLHPEVEWERVADVERPLHGRQAVREFMRPDVFATQHSEIHSIETIEDCVLVEGTFTGTGAQSGMEIAQRGYHLWRIEDGMAISFRYFLDRDEAVAAARA